MIHSILLSVDWNTGAEFDKQTIKSEKDAGKLVPKFVKRMEQDQAASPARDLKAQQIFPDGKMVML